jgi:uncharacterized protein YdhG (YjbR/CyaY superfamily)
MDSMVKSKAKSVEEYLGQLPAEQEQVISEVRDLIQEYLPSGYTESMNWGMISYEIPLERYPKTYNGKPLVYLSLAAQKNHYALYLMNVYQNPELEEYLKNAYKKEGEKLDLGKSCLRFQKLEDLHKEAIAKIISSTPPEEFIARYEEARKT